MSTSIRKEMLTEGEEEGPYINAPYPDEIVQVHTGETEGQKKVIQIIHENWPAPISELVEKSEYSDPFIRNVLRNKFAPAPQETRETEMEIEREEGKDVEWSEAFRAGLKLALTTDLSEEEASEAVGSGFIEGREIKEEINMR